MIHQCLHKSSIVKRIVHRLLPTPQLYNKYMGGVDQLCGYYSVRLKARENVAITNCYILSRHHTNSRTKTVKDFRANLAKELHLLRSEKRKRCYYCYHYHQRERHEVTKLRGVFSKTADESNFKSNYIQYTLNINTSHNCLAQHLSHNKDCEGFAKGGYFV